MRRLVKRWAANARDYLRHLLRFRVRRRDRRKDDRFEAPRRQLVSRLLLSFRAYRLYLPTAASSRDGLPLVVMLHGCGQDAQAFAEGTRMNQLAERHDFIVLYPEQSRSANSFGCWNWFHPTVLRGDGEAAAIARLVRRVVKRHGVDSTRVYVAGMSAGGAMVSVLANRHGNLFAACAVHSGLMYRAAASPSAALAAMRRGSSDPILGTVRETASPLPASAPFVPTLVIHGDLDNTVHPLNAEQIVEQVRTLAASHGTPPRPLTGNARRRVASSGRTAQIQDFERDGRIVLRKIIVEGLDHAWSGGDGRHRFNDPKGPDASQLIWDFVKDFRRAPGGKSTRLGSWRISLSAIWDRLRRPAS